MSTIDQCWHMLSEHAAEQLIVMAIARSNRIDVNETEGALCSIHATAFRFFGKLNVQ